MEPLDLPVPEATFVTWDGRMQTGLPLAYTSISETRSWLVDFLLTMLSSLLHESFRAQRHEAGNDRKS